jgi:cysteinyl-tRNA synthetase, unknown class
MILVVLGVLIAFGMQPVERSSWAPRQGPALADARTWGYQLQNVGWAAIADAVDVLVVDYSRDGTEARVLSQGDVEALRTRSDRSKRIVLAYMSIGEAENYRFYWRKSWVTGNPSWLGPENPEWKGNFPVRYWEQGWRELIMQPQGSLIGRLAEAVRPTTKPYLDRIIEAGFDGVYLDRVDAYDTWGAEKPDAQLEMVRLVTAISAYAKRRKPGFLVVPQNGEELLRFAEYRRVIDGVAKEDLVYGIGGDEQLNGAGDLTRSIADLTLAKAEGRPVFVVEYLADPVKRTNALRQLASSGFIVHFARRDLRYAPE